METRLTKWGNSLAVRIPQRILERASLREGDRLELSVHKPGSLSVRAVPAKIRLTDLVNAITPENLHRETDWGPAVGKEQL